MSTGGEEPRQWQPPEEEECEDPIPPTADAEQMTQQPAEETQARQDGEANPSPPTPTERQNVALGEEARIGDQAQAQASRDPETFVVEEKGEHQTEHPDSEGFEMPEEEGFADDPATGEATANDIEVRLRKAAAEGRVREFDPLLSEQEMREGVRLTMRRIRESLEKPESELIKASTAMEPAEQ